MKTEFASSETRGESRGLVWHGSVGVLNGRSDVIIRKHDNGTLTYEPADEAAHAETIAKLDANSPANRAWKEEAERRMDVMRLKRAAEQAERLGL